MADDNDSSANYETKNSINGTKEGASTSTISSDIKNNDILKFNCEHCDKFETTSHPLFLVHVVSCVALVKKQISDESEELSSNGPSVSITENGKSDNSSKKLFECDVCNMKFSNGANMRRHKMRHTGVKPYECRVCQKRFFRKDHLAEHFTTHTKTLPYHCPICNRGFQRQIAMRAHFQNEHVGQHDLVKTCPLCNYRAGTMKSLRVHFFNRHGIDLDNPGSATPSSLISLLSPKNAVQFTSTSSTLGSGSVSATAITPSYSDSGESLRSTENATPPMHFLSPHVEISMADNMESYNSDIPVTVTSKPAISSVHLAPALIQSTQSESNIASNSQNSFNLTQRNNIVQDDPITPSISLIPIKQEPDHHDNYTDTKNTDPASSKSSGILTSMSPLNSIIKVSPLKSLLREDLKRRICAKATTRANRNSSNTNINNNLVMMPSETISTSTSNGLNSSTGQEIDLSINRTVQLKCLFCRIEFPDQTLYFLHKGCHSDTNPWKCNICGEQCNNVYEFNSHLLSKSHQ